jgi:hypothetical protein
VRVRVEDLRVRRQLATKLVVPLRHQSLGTLQRVVHEDESSLRPPLSASPPERSI